jgi:HK97 family phage portal protein
MALFAPSRKAASFSSDLRDFFASRMSISGKAVNTTTALEVATVFACLRVLGEGVAQVPLKLILESKDGRSKLPAKDHWLYDILAFRPNPWQTSFEFREMLMWHVALTGNFFAFKNVVGGKIKELIPFEPGCVTVYRDQQTGELSYQISAANGATKPVPASAMWHVRGPSWNSWMGLEAVSLAREAIGLSMATEEQHARMHRNGVQASGAYSVEGTLSKEQNDMLRGWIEREMGGLANSGRPMVLDRSAKWISTAMTGVDAQHLETRKYQIEEICRFFRVIPLMVGSSDKAATYASAEQMFLAHVVHTLAPWYQRLEQSIDANLLTKKDRDEGYYSQFVEEGLLRGSIEATANMLEKYVNGGLMHPNEARAKLDLNADSDPASDKLRVPANIVGKTPATQGALNGA